MLRFNLESIRELFSNLIVVFSLFAVALREYFSQFGAVERSQVVFVSIFYVFENYFCSFVLFFYSKYV